ncbi:MAG TPA: DUF1579 family protein [Thermoanaerobaculia bacterium]|nr:DUF1579 family protein [Thermoanaerobaculia bacterium]
MARPDMARFGIFIGLWNTRGEVLATDASPATVLVATDSYRWLPGGKFIVHDVDARFGDEVTRSMEVIGYDLATRRYMARSYDDKGTSDTFEVELHGRRWRITGKTVRFDGRFSADGSRLTGLWELKGKRWQPWIDLHLERD